MLEPHYRMTPPERLPQVERQPVYLVLDNIRSAYNVGSMFRTGDACAAQHMHLCGMTAHPPNVKLAKTALGAFDYVPWTYWERTVDALEALRTDGVPIAALETTPDARSCYAYEWPKPVALVVGNEVTGVGEEALARADVRIQIPMSGHKNTLNAATAYGVVLFEIVRRWGVFE